MATRLQQTADRVSELARPRASVGIVAAVVLAGELIAMTLAWGATAASAVDFDDVVITLAVVAAASAALGQLARSGHVSEPGHRWLLSGWVVIAALAASGVADLPLRLTDNPAGQPGIDRALFLSATWTLALAVAVLGADLRAEAQRLPFVVAAVLLAVGLGGATLVDDGDLLRRASGPTTAYVLFVGVVLVVCLVALVLWFTRWQKRGGWSLTWSGTGLLLATTGLLLQLAAEFGNSRIWVAATGMLLSAMIVPGLGAFAAGTALAGAHTLARRQLREDLAGGAAGVQDLPMLEALQVRLAPVIRLDTSTPIGWLAHSELPGLSVDWWRSQAATMGLGSRLEAALAARALEVVAAEADPSSWVVVPVRADAVGEDLLRVLQADRTANLVVIVRGPAKDVAAVLPRLAETGVTTGVLVQGMDVRAMDAVDAADPALLAIDGALGHGVAHDLPRRSAAQGVVAWAQSRQRGVLAVDVDDPDDLRTLGDLGVRYGAGRATAGVAVGAGLEPDVEALGLIEAAGLREPQGPDRS